jgi:H+-translocating NAD(P) transhydrogenase subunit alpha
VSNEVIITSIFIFTLAAFLGFELIRRVPKLLHTPLMALTNALSAIALVASIVILGQSETTYAQVLGFIAVIASTINVVGGFLITDRMLKMFRSRERSRPAPSSDEGAPS